MLTTREGGTRSEPRVPNRSRTRRSAVSRLGWPRSESFVEPARGWCRATAPWSRQEAGAPCRQDSNRGHGSTASDTKNERKGAAEVAPPRKPKALRAIERPWITWRPCEIGFEQDCPSSHSSTRTPLNLAMRAYLVDSAAMNALNSVGVLPTASAP